jgi:Mrp family chromosome partitioning ATPase/capsular polysaccharide biosynthesis protein
VVNLLLPKTYEAETQLYISTPNHNDYNTVLGDQQAAKAFTSFPQSTSVLQATLRAAGVRGLSLSQLNSMITVDNSLDSQFVVIRVRDKDPLLAARLATVLTEQSMNQYETLSTDGGKLQFAQDELDRLGNEIKSLENLLTSLQGQGQAVSINDPTVKAARISDLTDQLNGLRQLYIELFNTEIQNGATPFLLQQINTVQTQINNLESILASLKGSGTSSNDPSVQSVRITQLQDELNGLRQLYVPLIDTYGNLTSPQVAVLQSAQVPTKPVGPGAAVAVAIGALAGLIAILGVIVFIEQTDDALRTPAKVSQATGLRTIISVKRLALSKGPRERVGRLPITEAPQPGLLLEDHLEMLAETTPLAIAESSATQAGQTERALVKRPSTALAEPVPASSVNHRTKEKASAAIELPEIFLTLGVFLRSERSQLLSSGSDLKSLLITSPQNGDGKTTIATRAALGLAKVGVKVVLIDANLRNPGVHDVFGLSNRIGLSSLLTANPIVDLVERSNDTSHNSRKIDRTGKIDSPVSSLIEWTFDLLQDTAEPNLSILPAGHAVASPAELLSSSRMVQIIRILSEKAMVIIDGPALLTASESMTLADMSDGTLIVVDARHATAHKLNQSLEMLRWINTEILGIVLNRAGSQN